MAAKRTWNVRGPCAKEPPRVGNFEVPTHPTLEIG